MADQTRRFEVRVWLPDRPGALGELAGRIGAVGGDVTEIEILETGGGSAIDDLIVVLPADVTPQRLVESIQSAEGVAVEEIVEVHGQRRDAAATALEVVRAVVTVEPRRRVDAFCAALRTLIGGEWAMAVDLASRRTVAATGPVPDADWLTAFLHGSRHLDPVTEPTPGDIVWCSLSESGLSVAAGRQGRVFHAREREQVRLLGEIVAQLIPAASAGDK